MINYELKQFNPTLLENKKELLKSKLRMTEFEIIIIFLKIGGVFIIFLIIKLNSLKNIKKNFHLGKKS